MSEPTAATTETPATTDPQAAPEAPADPKPQAPPWGDNFDPAVAWEKIQKANREAANLRQRVVTDEQRQQLDEYQRLVEASKTEQQRKDEALEAANRARDESQAELLRLRVALKHGISSDDFDLLGSGTEEQLEARAQRLAEKNQAAEALAAIPAPPGAPLARRPGEQLKPGATPPAPLPVAEEDYPLEWLSPAQRARVEKARGNTP